VRTVVFIGNFDVPYSTESHHAWTWERLGWQVVRLQENRTHGLVVSQACQKADLLQWTHTHGWHMPDESLLNPSNIRIPSFSYHLDKYFGIGSRQADYLKHPSFHLDYFFSTDGGNEEGWAQAGIRHIYLPAGVVEYGAYIAPVADIDIPVLFAGSVGYHAEYPFRPAMVAALQANYGSCFQIASGVRENALNTLYARTRVVVGDHIFAGAPYYASDRLFESIGRGAFIIYPRTPGVTEELENNGLVVYEPQNVDDLIKKIDFYLDIGHECDRIDRRNRLQAYVKQNHTYTQRLSKILQIMGLE
jgi:Glycosyl transferases group 1